MAHPTSVSIEAHLRQLVQERPLLTLRLDIINKCNLRCVMCHYSDDAIARRPAKYFTAGEFRSLFENVAPYVGDVMLSCADEPLLSKAFPEILEIVSSHPPYRAIRLATNATLMKPSISALLIKNGVTTIMLSMDGALKSTMERIRVGSKYEQVVANIKTLQELKRLSGAKYPSMVMNYVLMNSNIHEAPVFVELAKRLSASRVDFRHAVPTDYWSDTSEMLSNYQGKFNYFRARIIEASHIQGIDVSVPPPYVTKDEWRPQSEGSAVDLSDFEKVSGAHWDNVPTPKCFPADFSPGSAYELAVQEFSVNLPEMTRSWYERAAARTRTAIARIRSFLGKGELAPTRVSGIYCHRPFTDIQVRNFDEVLPCPWLKTTLGRLGEGKTLEEIFFGEEYQRLRLNMYNPDGDVSCQGCVEKADFMGRPVAAGKE